MFHDIIDYLGEFPPHLNGRYSLPILLLIADEAGDPARASLVLLDLPHFRRSQFAPTLATSPTSSRPLTTSPDIGFISPSTVPLWSGNQTP